MSIEETGQTGRTVAPDPEAASTPVDFVARMRALRQWSGLTMRQVAAKTRADGDFLPHSTLATALSRPSLPKEALVTAFIRACADDPDTVDRWVAVRKRIAAATAGSPEPVGDNGSANKPGETLPNSDEVQAEPPWGLPHAATSPPSEVVSPQAKLGHDKLPAAAGDGVAGSDLVLQEALPDDAAGAGPERPSSSYRFTEGTLAAAVRTRRNHAWVGLHRKRTDPDPDPDKPIRPLCLRALLPPLMYRTGWASRVLLGVLALLMVAVAIGVLARTLREVGDRAAGPASERSADPVDPEMAESPTTQTPAAATPTQRRTSRATPTPGVTLTSGAIAPGYYQMMPLATYGNSYCVGAGPEQGNSNRRDVAVLSLCANVVPASSALRRTGANTYQIYWADPAGGGGCLQVDHTENGEPATADVYLVAPHDYCDQPDQRFILEPVTTKHGQGYRLHTATAPQLCIGTLSGYTAEGTAISQATCAGSDTEIFIFQNA